jgi:segregation and condensation protein A
MSYEPPLLARFDGPLDLLLDLITRRELDITTVSLAAVAEDYLALMASLDQGDWERLSSYLVIASRLLMLKSLALLPRKLLQEVEEDATDLVRQLEEHKLFKELATVLKTRHELGGRMYARQTVGSAAVPLAPASLSSAELIFALRRALSRLPASLPEEVMPSAQYHVAAKLASLRETLCRGDSLRLFDLVANATCRQEVIALFLAVLELLRQGEATAEQSGLFGDVLVAAAQAPVDGERQ